MDDLFDSPMQSKVEVISSIDPSVKAERTPKPAQIPPTIASSKIQQTLLGKQPLAQNTNQPTSTTADETQSNAQSNKNSLIIKYVVIGLAIVVLVSVLVYVIYKYSTRKFASELASTAAKIKEKDTVVQQLTEEFNHAQDSYKDAIAEITKLRKANATSERKVKELEHTINNAFAQFNENGIPVNEATYDLSDVKGDVNRNDEKSRKEALMRIVNSKRTTNQDIIDSANVENDFMNEQAEQIKKELAEMTGTEIPANDKVEEHGEQYSSSSESEEVVHEPKKEAFVAKKKGGKVKTQNKAVKIAIDSDEEADNLISIISNS